ncbi:MAG: phosphatidylglycerophosphatase A family protein [Planctomycetota bacterium]
MRIFWTCFGLGESRYAPGTFGTLGGVAIAAGALLVPAGLVTQVYLGVAAAVVFLVGVPLGNAAEKEMGGKDPGAFVVDEVAGYLVALLGHPLHDRPVLLLVGAFLFFRLFDIWKPWPIRSFETVKGGVGIMIDDVLAGVYANLCLQVLLAVV